ncbi:hypothetical protein [Azospirillum himalayense]|uniref:Uncharacterized protein n=1 Tax=Azospirillum himalayense TaxID=654847 RepID=A0ABW0GBM7_9PROT
MDDLIETALPEAVASAELPPEWSLRVIADAAGGDDRVWYDGARLHVPGVTQEALDAAVAAYDPERAPAGPVPAVISDRQFFQALAMDGYITPAEALAAVRTGELPAVLADLIAHMDEDERFGAEMLLSGATEFRRDHPMTIAIGGARGLTDGEVDDFFRRTAAL